MKYIRTKNDHLLEVIRESESKESYITKPNGWVIHKDKVIKQADTIEELCDEFICNACQDYIGPHGSHYIDETLLKARISKKIFLENLNKWCEIYGAIWTNKGLIYVAKMNENGELELL